MNIIKEFEKIRDILYRIPLSIKEPDECCTGKAKRLFDVFKEGGYEVRYRLGKCKWSALDFPKEIKNIPHDDDSSHTYLEAKIDGEWKIVDATWDKKLENIFHINEWDGKSDTTIAMPITEYLSPEESLRYIEHILTSEAISADLKINRDFYQAFNEWLQANRK